MARLRVGIVGADAGGQGWAPLSHFPALRALPDEFEIAALCTRREESAKAAAAHFGVPRAYHDYHALCAAPDIDIVAVVVRAPNHYDVVMAALAAGKPVYCEWPLAVTSVQADALAALAAQKGVPAVVGLQARCDPTLRYARDLVAQGYVGEVLAVTMAMISPSVAGRTAARAWEAKHSGGVSALTVRGMHSLDPTCMIIGELSSLTARVTTQVRTWTLADTGETIDVEVPDNVMLSGAVAGGAGLSAHIANVPTAVPGFRLEIYGADGSLRITTPGAPQRDLNTLAGAKARAAPAPMDVPDSYLEVPASVPAGPPRNVAALYRRLAKAMATGTPVEPDFTLGAARHRLMDAINASATSGCKVAF